MQYTKIQPHSFLTSGEEDFFKCFTIIYYMGMAAVLLNGMEIFEQTVNTLSIEGHI